MAALHDIVKKGSVDRSVEVTIVDSADGTPETAVVYNTAGIDLWYRREGAALVSITEATLAALTTAHTDGGFLHIANGRYRLDLPDAAFATGANYVDFGGTVTGMIVHGGRVRLVDIDIEDTVRMGLTALPNAAAEASGGIFTRGTGAGQINQAANGQIDTRIVGGTFLTSGTAAAISASSITLASGHNITDTTVYIELTGGTNAVGKGRAAVYSGTGDEFTVDPAWNATVNGNSETTPSGTITYRVYSLIAPPSTNLMDVNSAKIGGQTASASGTVTFPAATLASTTNITAGTITTATNVTTVNGLAAGAITAASIATGAIDADSIAADAGTEIAAAVLTSAMTEAYPTDGSTMTVAQALYLIAQSIGEFSVSGTTVTVKKLDGTTTAATYTLDSSTAPTSRTRAT